MTDRLSESAELIQAKAAQSANYIQLIGVLVTAIGTIGGLIVTVYLMRPDASTTPQPTPAVVEGDFAPDADVRGTAPTAGTAVAPAATKTVKAVPGVKAVSSGSADMKLDLGEGVAIDLVLVKAGTFQIGSPSSESNRGYDEGPQHEVAITTDFYIGKYEVTQMQYEKIIGSNPSHFKDAASPVEKVSWQEANEFCRRLSTSSGKTVRLPTEAEWEYACRAGTTTPFHFGPSLGSDSANIDGTGPYGGAPVSDYRKRTVAVASFPPNQWKIHDMHGNVMEWCSDFYAASYIPAGDPDKDPAGPESGSSHVLRGGAWTSKAQNCRSADRTQKGPTFRSNEAGFRIVVE
jgi:formylglycine-generating enzyme required for sulfatase activity